MSDAAIVEYNLEQNLATYRASSLSACVNALLASRLGYDRAELPEDHWLMQRFKAGHEHEPLILRRLIDDYGFVLDGAQDEVTLPVGQHARIVGHVDALHDSHPQFPIQVTHVNGERVDRMIDTEGIIVVDAKALSQGSTESWLRDRFKAFPYYAWQQRMYMLATGDSGLVMAVKNKNTDDFYVEFFTPDYMDRYVKRVDIIKKVLQVEKLAAVGNGALFSEPCTKMFPCPFFYLHPDEEKKTNTTGADEEVLTLSAERADLKAQVTALTAELNDVETKIRRKMGNSETSMRFEDRTVTLYYAGGNATDWDAIAKATGVPADDAKAQFTKKTKSDKLSIRDTPKRGKQ